jgi:hypothetical protein
MSVSCGLANMTMTLDYSILDSSSNSTVDSGNMSWIASNSNYTNEIWNTTLTQSGTYRFDVVLGYYDVNQTWIQLDTDYDFFSVMNQTNGGGNNGGNNSGNDSHCLIIDYVVLNNNGTEVFLNLTNTCSFSLNYPGVNSTVDNPGVTGLPNQTSWFYMMPQYSSYSLTWQLNYDQSVLNGTVITFNFSAWILNCGDNGTWHQCPDSANSISSYSFVYLSSDENGNNTGGNNTGGNNTGGNTVTTPVATTPQIPMAMGSSTHWITALQQTTLISLTLTKMA